MHWAFLKSNKSPNVRQLAVTEVLSAISSGKSSNILQLALLRPSAEA